MISVRCNHSRWATLKIVMRSLRAGSVKTARAGARRGVWRSRISWAAAILIPRPVWSAPPPRAPLFTRTTLHDAPRINRREKLLWFQLKQNDGPTYVYYVINKALVKTPGITENVSTYLLYGEQRVTLIQKLYLSYLWDHRQSKRIIWNDVLIRIHQLNVHWDVTVLLCSISLNTN